MACGLPMWGLTSQQRAVRALRVITSTGGEVIRPLRGGNIMTYARMWVGAVVVVGLQAVPGLSGSLDRGMGVAGADSAVKKVKCDKRQTLTEALRKAKRGDTLQVTGTCQERVTITTDRFDSRRRRQCSARRGWGRPNGVRRRGHHRWRSWGDPHGVHDPDLAPAKGSSADAARPLRCSKRPCSRMRHWALPLRMARRPTSPIAHPGQRLWDRCVYQFDSI